MNSNSIWPIPSTRRFNDQPLQHKAPLLFWATFAAITVFMYLRWLPHVVWTAWVGWFLLPFLAMAWEHWRWKGGLRRARKRKSRELMRDAQQRLRLN